jgi:hypothetical protein
VAVETALVFVVVVMPLQTNKGSKAEDAMNEQLIHIGPLPRTSPNCRDEVIAAFEELIERHGDRPFTAREVYEQMSERGTSYAELTVCTAMKRMKGQDPRRPDVKLERARKSGFQLVRVAV